MFEQWTDEKLIEEVDAGFDVHAQVKRDDNMAKVEHLQAQIDAKLKEINEIEWEIAVANKDIEEWNAVLARIEALLNPETPVEEPVETEPEQPTDPTT